jgi:hypothetical protein
VSSGNSLGDADLTRRPLVVSFKKKRPLTPDGIVGMGGGLVVESVVRGSLLRETSQESVLQPVSSCLHSPCLGGTGASSLLHNQHHEPPALVPPGHRPLPRIEDIEIFQESQLVLKRRQDGSRRGGEDPMAQSQSVDIHQHPSTNLHNQSAMPLVKKSYTLPCLVIN